MRSTWGSEFRKALEVPRWTLRFYGRHLPWVVGLSVVGSVQRLLVVNRDVPVPFAVASEVVVALARLVLVVLVVRFVFRGVSWKWANAKHFLHDRWRALVFQSALLAVAFLVFDQGLEALVGRENVGLLLFIKNPTIIALTVIWEVGLARQILTHFLTDGHEGLVGTPSEWNVPLGKDSRTETH
jgi:hypothetical protein